MDAVAPPAAPIRSPRLTPYPASTTPGAATAPPTVARKVPGSSGVPALRNQPAPCRAMRAMCARVSTFCTNVGAPPTPDSVTRIRLSAGTAERPDTPATATGSSPARRRLSSTVLNPPATAGGQVEVGGVRVGECAA